ncbi:MAG: hypothetical protein ACRC6T_03650 [Sarcina sp.]
MKLKYIAVVSLVVVISVAYYIGNSISKETHSTTKEVSSIKDTNDNNVTKVTYSQTQQKELADAKKLVSARKYPVQTGIGVVSLDKNQNGILIPKGTYIYKVNGGKIGLANREFNMYAVSSLATIKDDVSNPFQTKPSEYNVDKIFTNAKKMNIIGAINGYYYVSYNEPGSSNVSYGFVKPSDIKLLTNIKPRQLKYTSDLKLYRLSNIEDYKVSGFDIYKTPYMLSNIETTLSYNKLKDFNPIIISSVGDTVEIFYNNQIGWIHSDRLIEI